MHFGFSAAQWCWVFLTECLGCRVINHPSLPGWGASWDLKLSVLKPRKSKARFPGLPEMGGWFPSGGIFSAETRKALGQRRCMVHPTSLGALLTTDFLMLSAQREEPLRRADADQRDCKTRMPVDSFAKKRECDKTRSTQSPRGQHFFLPTWNQSINLKRGVMSSVLRYTKSECSANSLPVCRQSVNLQRYYRPSPRGSTFYASFPPFVERPVIIRRLLSEHEVRMEWLFLEGLQTPH